MTVTLYSKPACVQCDATKRRLDKLGVPYLIADVTENPSDLARIIEWGYQQVPVVEVQHNGKVEHWSGFRPDKLQGLATRKGAS